MPDREPTVPLVERHTLAQNANAGAPMQGSTPPSGPRQELTQLLRQYKWLKWLLIIIVLALIVLFIVALAHSFTSNSVFAPANGTNPANQGPVTRSFQVGDHALIVINGHGSDVNIHAGSAGSVIVTARRHGSGQGPNPDDTKVLYNQAQDNQGHDHLTIGSDPILRDIDYDVTVPASAQVQVVVNSGSISASGISGIAIDTGSGSLDVENVQGPVNIHTDSGDITARNIKGQMTMEAGSGSIRVTGANGQLKATTHSGDVIVRSGTLSGQSALKTDSGSVRFEGALDAKGSYQLSTNSGDIDLTLPANTAFQLAATTGSGNVNNAFGSNSVGVTPRAQITATIGSGSVVVSKAA
jgi:Putative adhesin